MSQQINLYLAEFREQKDALNATNIARLTLFLVLALGGVTGLEYWHSNTLSNSLAEQKSEHSQLLASANNLARSLQDQAGGQDFLQTESQLSDNLQSKQQILKLLGDNRADNSAGFSHYLTDLSNYHIPGLRLTGVDLKDGGKEIFLRGEVQAADRLPQFLLSLNKSEAFRGLSFSSLQIEEVEDDEDNTVRLFFNLTTEPLTEGTGSI